MINGNELAIYSNNNNDNNNTALQSTALANQWINDNNCSLYREYHIQNPPVFVLIEFSITAHFLPVDLWMYLIWWIKNEYRVIIDIYLFGRLLFNVTSTHTRHFVMARETSPGGWVEEIKRTRHNAHLLVIHTCPKWVKTQTACKEHRE